MLGRVLSVGTRILKQADLRGDAMPRTDPTKTTEPLPEVQPASEVPATEREIVVHIDRRRGFLGVIVVLLVVISLFLAGRTFDWFPNFGNPFGEKTIDRSQPTMLKSVQDLSRYEAATGNFQVVIDVEKDAKFLPAAIKGERTLFVASGSVDVFVDFGAIGGSALKVSEDRRTVEVRLPRPGLEKPNLDSENSYVFEQNRGIVDRLKSLVADDPNRMQQLYTLSEQRLEDAAQKTELIGRAEKNTKSMLEGLFRSLGFTTVTVTFTSP
jgi:hypothetical protein